MISGARALAGALLALALAGAAAGPPEGGEPAARPATPPEARADHALLEGIIAEEEISTQRSVTRVAWLRHVAGTLWSRAMNRLAEAGPLIAFLARALLWIVVVGVPLIIAFLVWRWLRGVDSRRLKREVGDTGEDAVELPEEGDLRAALEAELAAGRARAALRLAWIWMARRLAGRGVGRFEVDVTNREFAASVRRLAPEWPGHAGLESLARRTERLLYDDVDCAAEDVRRFVREAEELSA